MFNHSINKIFHVYLAVCFIAVFFACADNVETDVDYELDDEYIPVQESWDSVIRFTEQGVLKAILYSDHFKVYDQPKQKLIDGVRLEFFNDEGVLTSSLRSDHGKIDDVTENMYAMDSVVAVNDSAGIILETEQLMWRKKDGKIVTEKYVKITSEDEIIEGYGLESDQDLKNYTIFDITYQTFQKKQK